MNFFKKNIKLIIGFIVGIILASGITVYATSYFAGDVKYIRNNTETTVEAALNDLYDKQKENSNIVAEGTINEDELTPDKDGYLNINLEFQPRYILMYADLGGYDQVYYYKENTWYYDGWSGNNSAWAYKNPSEIAIKSNGFKCYTADGTSWNQMKYIAIK